MNKDSFGIVPVMITPFHEDGDFTREEMVGVTGIEPVPPAMSTQEERRPNLCQVTVFHIFYGSYGR